MAGERGRRCPWRQPAAPLHDAQQATATTGEDGHRCRTPSWSPTSALLVAELPTYGYRRVHALLRRQAQATGRAVPNPKRVYRVMKVHGLLLQRDGEQREERRHDGRVAVDQRNTRWCSDGLEIACDNGEKVRVAFALDCCDREAMGHVATTGGITAEDVQDLMVATVEHRYGPVNRLPKPIEWLSDNGSCYTARDTRAFARDIGLIVSLR